MKLTEAKQLFFDYNTLFADHPIYNHGMRVMMRVIDVCEVLNITKNDSIKIAAKYHDIGKITWSSKMLDANRDFTKNEIKKIKNHIISGKDILEVIFPDSDIPTLVLLHHERIDGSGYLGYKREELPAHLQIGSQIIAVCDSYDAMFRIYNQKTEKEAKKILEDGRGKVLDERVVDAFFKII